MQNVRIVEQIEAMSRVPDSLPRRSSFAANCLDQLITLPLMTQRNLKFTVDHEFGI